MYTDVTTTPSSAIFSARLLVEGLHHTGPFEMSDDIETLAGVNGALVTLVDDTGSQGRPKASCFTRMPVQPLVQCACCMVKKFKGKKTRGHIW